MKPRLFFKIYDPIRYSLIVILVLLVLSEIISYCMGYKKNEIRILDYIVVVVILLITLRIALHLYISKVIRDEKREKERVGNE